MSDINLLKNEYSGTKGGSSYRPGSEFSFGSEKSSRPALFIVLGLIVLEVVLYGGLIFYERQIMKQQQAVDEEFADVKLQVSALTGRLEDAVEAQKKLKNLSVLLDNQLYWTSVIAELEDFTYNRVVYTSIDAMESSRELIIRGMAPSYTDIGKLMLGLESSPNVESVILETTSPSDEEFSGYQFGIVVVFSPDLLKGEN